MDMSESEIISVGYSKIIEISDHAVLRRNQMIFQKYNLLDDQTKICECLQLLFIHGKYRWLNTFKTVLDDQNFFNMGYPLEMLGKPGVILNELLGDVLIDKNGWVKYEVLSHREKEILQLVAKGFTSTEISEKLFLSEHTIKTHRKNIGYKLGIKNNSEWVRFAMAFEMI
ncbi:MAG: DNA-binding CsgD family transcriptional regulator [Marinoscillum sp.]|jgi:DNA-binding CsgD family transcriptional regulator